MEKEFVPYELAVKLKALDYDEPCFGYYCKGVLSIEIIKSGKIFTNEDSIYFDKDSSCLAPTFSQAFRWFREKHGFPSYVDMDDYSYYRFTIYKGIAISEAPHETYEEAEVACLTKLIEIVEKIKSDDEMRSADIVGY